MFMTCDMLRREVEAVSFNYLRREWNILDPALAEDFKQLEEVEDAEFSVVSETGDQRTWIVTFSKDDGPSASYIYNRCLRCACCCCCVLSCAVPFTLCLAVPFTLCFAMSFMLCFTVPFKLRPAVPLTLCCAGMVCVLLFDNISCNSGRAHSETDQCQTNR